MTERADPRSRHEFHTRRIAGIVASIAAAVSGRSPPVAAATAPAPPAAAAPVAAAPAAAASAASAASAPAVAAARPAHPTSIPAEYTALAAKLQKQFAQYPIDSIRPSGVAGIVEVLFGGNRIIYSDATGSYFFNGHLFDLDGHRDLTDERLEEVTRIDVRQLPLADAFDVVRGNGKRTVYLFEDPDCPYCRKLEEQLPKVNDVTFHVFLYPLTSLHPHALEHALGIWCATDRPKAWADEMLKGIDPKPAKCDNPLERNVALGDKLHIDGTPTIILANGRPHSGTVTADELEQLLATVPVR